MWRRIVFVVGLTGCTAPATATAGELHRCVGPAGVTYQQVPCGPGQVLSKTIPVIADEPAEKPKAAKSQRKSGPVRRAPSGARGSKTTRSIEQRRSACATAKASRDEKLERLGLRRTFEDLRKLDGPVQAACRGL
jgi:hypothetical protein